MKKIVVFRLPFYWDLQPKVVVGSSSMYEIPTRTQYIDEQQALEWEGEPYSPYSLTREIIRRNLRKSGWYGKPPFPIPFYAVPCKGDFFMVDLSDAYLQILSRFGFEPDFSGGRVRYGRSLAGILPGYSKAMGRALVGLQGPFSAMTIWDGESLKGEWHKNPLSHPPTITVVYGFLHALAAKFSDSAVYIHTDSICVPLGKESELVEFLEELGVRYKVKAFGEGEIKGVGAWRVGNTATDFFFNRVIPLPYSNVKRDESLQIFLRAFRNSPYREDYDIIKSRPMPTYKSDHFKDKEEA